MSGYPIGVSGKRPVAYDRVFGVGVDIHDGREIEIDAQGFEFVRHHRRDCMGQVGIVLLSDASHGREGRERVAKANHTSPLLVDGDEGDGPVLWCGFANRSCQLHDLMDVPHVSLKQDQAAQPIGECTPDGIGHGRWVPVEPDHQHLGCGGLQSFPFNGAAHALYEAIFRHPD